jgi:hypothetical protein
LGNHRSRRMRQALSKPHFALFRLAAVRCRGKAAATRYHPRAGWDDFSLNLHSTLALYLSVIFSENRSPLFGIML